MDSHPIALALSTATPRPPAVRAARWRWLCGLLALILPLQSVWIGSLRTQGPSHGHQAPRAAASPRPIAAVAVAPVTPQRVRAALRQGHGSRQVQAPAFAAWSAPAALDREHVHADGERHHHVPGDASVDRSHPAADAQAETAASRDGLVWAPPRRATAPAEAPLLAAQPPQAVQFASRVVLVPDKPPRA